MLAMVPRRRRNIPSRIHVTNTAQDNQDHLLEKQMTTPITGDWINETYDYEDSDGNNPGEWFSFRGCELNIIVAHQRFGKPSWSVTLRDFKYNNTFTWRVFYQETLQVMLSEWEINPKQTASIQKCEKCGGEGVCWCLLNEMQEKAWRVK